MFSVINAFIVRLIIQMISELTEVTVIFLPMREMTLIQKKIKETLTRQVDYGRLRDII